MTDHSREDSVAEQPAPDQAAHDPLPTAAFFHDPAAFDALVAMVIPSLLHSKAQASSLRIWAPGCATGEETYSIAILIDEQLAQLATRLPIQLFATDVDASALAVARQGRYAARAIDRVSPERLARYFVREGQAYQVAKRIRERCVFSTHNLSSDPPFGRMDLIVCRNLPTLLADDDGGQLMPLLHYALAPGGYLFLGTAAATIDAGRIGELFWIVDAPHQIYQRKERLASARTSFSWGQRRAYQAGAARQPGPSGAEDRGAIERDFLRGDDRQTAVLDDPQEIQHIRATLQATISQLEDANLDLTAMNEELCSLNEELQATNDELQIAKEQSQAINEELQSVNAELSQKIAQLDRANADTVNLFTSTQLPVIFLHADGRIARFTPQATELFALIDTDVGRPISDIATYLADDLHPFLADAIHGLAPSETVVYQPACDCWWNLRIRPYRTLTGQIDGLVLTFVDITLLKRTEAVLQESLDALERRDAERTQDLAAANVALQAEIAERTRSEQARRQLLQQIVTAQEAGPALSEAEEGEG